MEIILKNSYEIKTILYQTNALFFKDLKKGDIIKLEFLVNYIGRNNGRLYASKITISNNDNYTIKSPNELNTILKNFELEELGWDNETR
jgi:hypothetical protein